MKILIAIKGCERDAGNGCHQAMRDTWLRDVPAARHRPCYDPPLLDLDAFFFVGYGSLPLQTDEVRLPCDDGYMALPRKTRAILEWALARGYDFVFLCDTDTYVVPERLVRSGFEHYDLVGLFNGAIGEPNATEGRYWAWISGGNGYWLSARAARAVLAYPLNGDWAEDRMVGQALGPRFQDGSLKALSCEDYGFHTDGDEWLTRVTSHYCSHGKQRAFDPTWMYRKHAYNARGIRV